MANEYQKKVEPPAGAPGSESETMESALSSRVADVCLPAPSSRPRAPESSEREIFGRPCRRLYPLTLCVLLLLGLGCGDRSAYFERIQKWSGPHVLDTHVLYLEQYSGRVVVVKPRDEINPTREFNLALDTERGDDFRHVVTFPDNSHIVFVSLSRRTFYIIDDETGQVAWTLTDLPIEFDGFAFSRDGRYLVGYQRGVELSSMEDNIQIPPYRFTSSRSILSNSHTLLILDRTTGEVSMPTLARNDAPIGAVGFTGAFKVCPFGYTCALDEALDLERIVVFGESRLWMVDPTVGEATGSDVIPLSLSGVGFRPARMRTSSNLEDDGEARFGMDNRESLFLTGVGSRDIVAVNMVWDETDAKLAYSINKLGLSITPRSIMPYLDGGDLYLLATSGTAQIATVHVASARSSLMGLPSAVTDIHALTDGERVYPLLYGGPGLVMVNTVNLDVFGEKNITSVDFGFTPERLAFGGGDNAMAVAVDRHGGRLAAVELEELKARDLSTSVFELTDDLRYLLVDEQDGRLIMLSSEDEAGWRGLYVLSFDGREEELRVEVADVDDQIHLMRSAGEGDLILLDNGYPEGGLTAIADDGSWAHTYRGFLLGKDLF